MKSCITKTIYLTETCRLKITPLTSAFKNPEFLWWFCAFSRVGAGGGRPGATERRLKRRRPDAVVVREPTHVGVEIQKPLKPTCLGPLQVQYCHKVQGSHTRKHNPSTQWRSEQPGQWRVCVKSASVCATRFPTCCENYWGHPGGNRGVWVKALLRVKLKGGRNGKNLALAGRWQVRKRSAFTSWVSPGSSLFHTGRGSCSPPEGICSRR